MGTEALMLLVHACQTFAGHAEPNWMTDRSGMLSIVECGD